MKKSVRVKPLALDFLGLAILGQFQLKKIESNIVWVDDEKSKRQKA